VGPLGTLSDHLWTHHRLTEGVRARVSQPSFYNSLPVCSIMAFRTYLKENRQEL
jgi:hypothetical protein